jgi:proteasome activator subunit 4
MDEDVPSVGTVDEAQLKSIQSYINSVPYTCETVEEMRVQLGGIVGNIAVCISSKNWPLLTTWDGVLQCWIELKYPIPKSTRAKLVKVPENNSISLIPMLISEFLDVL